MRSSSNRGEERSPGPGRMNSITEDARWGSIQGRAEHASISLRSCRWMVVPGGLGRPRRISHARSGTQVWRRALRLREDLPQGFAIHETATISTMWPAMPCFSNLVLFDPLKTTHRMDAIVGELAERWSWQDNDRSLVFFLRTGTRWHDGTPVSSKDVKFTFDLLRETPDASARLRINPRRDWYTNVEAVEAVDPQTVVFRLRRPQPSLLLMLASGYTPIYAAHVPPASYRTGCVGTGPFRLKEWRKGEFVEYVKNPDYFVKGRPYLAGLRYLIIGERGTATAALQAGRVDTAFPGQTPKPIAERLRKAVPQLVMTPVSENGHNN